MKKIVILILSAFVFLGCNNDDSSKKAGGPVGVVVPQNNPNLRQLASEDLNRPLYEFNKEQQMTLLVTNDVKLSIYTSPYEPEKMEISLFSANGASPYTTNYCSMHIESDSLSAGTNTFTKGDQFIFNFADKSLQSSADSTWATVVINVKPVFILHPEKIQKTATIECTKYSGGNANATNNAKYMTFNEFNSQIEFFGSVLKGN